MTTARMCHLGTLSISPLEQVSAPCVFQGHHPPLVPSRYMSLLSHMHDHIQSERDNRATSSQLTMVTPSLKRLTLYNPAHIVKNLQLQRGVSVGVAAVSTGLSVGGYCGPSLLVCCGRVPRLPNIGPHRPFSQMNIALAAVRSRCRVASGGRVGQRCLDWPAPCAWSLSIQK